MNILLIADRPGWAFANRAHDLIARRFTGLRFTVRYQHDVAPADHAAYDLVYPMSITIAWRLHKAGMPAHRMAAGVTSLDCVSRYIGPGRRIAPELLAFINKLRGINAWSDEIVSLFKPHCRIYKTRIGIDETLFRPAAVRRAGTGRPFVVGWAGRIDVPKRRELKGYDLVTAALKGLDVKLDIRTFTEHYVPRKQMVGFYQGLDCFICSSQSEGLPNPLLEAAACGVPLITTRVGVVPELIRQGHNGLIINRSEEAIRQAVVYLMRRPERCRRLGKHIRSTIVEGWTWKKCGREWERFFRAMLKSQ